MNAIIPAQRSADVMQQLRAFFRLPEPIVDVTWGQGRFWPKGEARVIGCDRYTRAQITADWGHLPFRDGTVGTLVYDPPFLPRSGPNSNWLARGYGAGQAAWSASDGFAPGPHLAFFEAARRALRLDGVVVAKTADTIQWHRPYWLTLIVLDAARSVGFQLYDWVVAYRAAPLRDPRWKTAHHVRKHHAHWLVFVPPGARLER